ncbi:MAG TPA: sigma-54 dependent transcriptional regulator [Candidatus Binatia bacterium]|jgi:DNA-binding NtrC family response regulator|nr:sigma-54 dependent transcriptional regulator [Candidatus Binatia bacterium]
MPSRPHILVVDDDPLICQQLERTFKADGYNVAVASHAEQALQVLEDEYIDLVVTDIRLPGLNGVELTKRIVERWSDVPVIVMTAYAEIENAVEVLKLGASDYIVKPFSVAAIQESTRLVLEKAGFFTEIRKLRRELKDSYVFGRMHSRSSEMHQVFETIRTVASTDATVVVEGETGTGKELVASTIHHQSARKDGPFVTINCGGLPESLLESELFGHERGAFTGADQPRLGKIELAHRGTLFLDEIENISLTMQAKLLLVLHNQKVQRLGSSGWTRVDMRVVAASNVPLKELLAQGKMRSDFFYRIHVIRIQLLPLRQRLDDIPILVEDFLRHHPVALKKKITGILPSGLTCLMRYHWPGNIRELHNVLEKAVILAKSRFLNARDLDVDSTSHNEDSNKNISTELSLYHWIQEQEKDYLIDKLKRFRGRIDRTAKSCGVDVRTLHRKLQVHGLDKKTFNQRALETRFRNSVKPQTDH